MTFDDPNTRPLYDCVNILDVLLRQSSATLHTWALPSEMPRLELFHEVEVKRHEDIVVAEVRLQVAGKSDEELVLEINGTYALLYKIAPGRDTSPDDLADFGGGTALFNVWPFWRELVSSYYSRMKLPLPPLPSLSPNHGIVFGPAPGEE